MKALHRKNDTRKKAIVYFARITLPKPTRRVWNPMSFFTSLQRRKPKGVYAQWTGIFAVVSPVKVVLRYRSEIGYWCRASTKDEKMQPFSRTRDVTTH